MTDDFRKKMLIQELEIRAEMYERYQKGGAQFYNDICERNKVSCLEEMKTSDLIKEVDRIYENNAQV